MRRWFRSAICWVDFKPVTDERCRLRTIVLEETHYVYVKNEYN